MMKNFMSQKVRNISERYNIALQFKSFYADKNGLAAVELAVLFPLLAFSFILMVDLAQAVTGRYDTERKMRLAIEGILRYGDDVVKVETFANAFAGSIEDPSRGGTLTIGPYKVCRSDNAAVIYKDSEVPECPNPESWYNIAVNNSVTGMFGTELDISTSTDLFSE